MPHVQGWPFLRKLTNYLQAGSVVQCPERDELLGSWPYSHDAAAAQARAHIMSDNHRKKVWDLRDHWHRRLLVTSPGYMDNGHPPAATASMQHAFGERVWTKLLRPCKVANSKELEISQLVVIQFFTSSANSRQSCARRRWYWQLKYTDLMPTSH